MVGRSIPVGWRKALLVLLCGASLLPALFVCAPTPLLANSPPQDPAIFEATRRATLDGLFKKLAGAGNDETAQDIVQQIWLEWTYSGRGDVDALMLQAGSAMGHRDFRMASVLLDEVVQLVPDFAEGWNRRATLRWMMDDHAGSQADIDKVLALEPRHFGALAGRAMILVEAERFKEALDVYRRALAINPFLPERHQVIPMLEKKIETKL